MLKGQIKESGQNPAHYTTLNTVHISEIFRKLKIMILAFHNTREIACPPIKPNTFNILQLY
jgi:hypothetical protein